MTQPDRRTRIFRQQTPSGAVLADRSHESRIGERITPLDSGCWVYQGGTRAYPKVRAANGQMVSVHRWVFETMLDITVPSEMHLHHTCLNARCVNPHHLEVVTPAEHAARHRALRGDGGK